MTIIETFPCGEWMSEAEKSPTPSLLLSDRRSSEEVGTPPKKRRRTASCVKKGGKSQNSAPPLKQAECLCFEPLIVGEEDETQVSQAPESGTAAQESGKVTQNQRRATKTRGKRANSSQTHAVCSILMAVLSQDSAVKVCDWKDGTKGISWAAWYKI